MRVMPPSFILLIWSPVIAFWSSTMLEQHVKQWWRWMSNQMRDLRHLISNGTNGIRAESVHHSNSITSHCNSDDGFNHITFWTSLSKRCHWDLSCWACIAVYQLSKLSHNLKVIMNMNQLPVTLVPSESESDPYQTGHFLNIGKPYHLWTTLINTYNGDSLLMCHFASNRLQLLQNGRGRIYLYCTTAA